MPPPPTGEEDVFTGLRYGLGKSCKLLPERTEQEFITPLFAIPIIAAAGKFVFDVGVDYLAGLVEELREKSKAEYSAKISVNNLDLIRK